MTDEYISKQYAVNAINDALKRVFTEHVGEGIINPLKPADVAPVVHAYWIPQKENHEFKEALMNCSACGYPVSRWTGNTNFCPNCGAKMDGGESDD